MHDILSRTHHHPCLPLTTTPVTPRDARRPPADKIPTQQEQQNIQDTVAYFFEKLTTNPDFQRAKAAGLLSCPLSEGWEKQPYRTHIVPIWTKPRHEQYLFFHLMSENMNAYSFAYPVVPKGKSRVRIVFHAHNTRADVDKTVGSIADWAREMLDTEPAESATEYVPRVASEVYSMKAATVQV